MADACRSAAIIPLIRSLSSLSLSQAMTAAITAEQLAAFTEASTAELARRLDEDDYPSPFDGLSDWHLMRALAIHRPELARPYLHLVDQEPFDED
jgi:hypothetical protein